MKLEKYETPNLEVMSFDGENLLCASVVDDFIKSADEQIGTLANNADLFD